MADFIHSVTLDRDKCLGCTNCIKRCPTSAIRVENGKARIISSLCIDCGECIRVCPHHAKIAVCQSLDVLDQYEYTIALPAPSLYAQFNNLEGPEIVVEGLRILGFDDVFEVAQAAELVSDATRKYIKASDSNMTLISSACPTISRLIRIRFPDLIDNLLPLLTPAELAGKLARERAMRETGLPADKIGTVFISPCTAKASSIYSPIGLEKSNIDAVISIKDVYTRLVGILKQAEETCGVSDSGRVGVSWGSSGGEGAALLTDSYLAADGIENCIKVLNEMEDEKLENIKFVELNACPGGCVGGVFTVENPFISRVKLTSLRKYLPPYKNIIRDDFVPDEYRWSSEMEYRPVMELDPDMEKAFAMMEEVERLTAKLPGLNCGSCGSPSCRALAEDIVRGYSTENACVFVLRDEVQHIADLLSKISGIGMGRKPVETKKNDHKSK